MTKNKFPQIIVAIVWLLGLATSIACLCTVRSKYAPIAYLIMFALTALYTLFLYKKPHGNLLRWLMLTFAAILLPDVYYSFARKIAVQMLLYVVAIGLICYAAGRLDHIKSNTFIFLAVLIIFVCIIVLIIIRSPARMVNIMRPAALLWLFVVLVSAYIFRYKEHKAAGLVDKQ